jgi:choloylglycine hydrolase
MVKRVLFSLTLVVAVQPVLDACTTFCVRAGNQVLFGRNYDFEIGDGMVMVNPAGAEKRGYLQGGPSWRSTYGSVTFNQFGRGFPMGGLNQAGVVVELMWLNDTEYPAREARSPLTVLEWIQYQLDTAGSVADVIASDSRVRIQGRTPLHYLVSDRTGASATIEFLQGRLVTHRGAELPFTALANDTYAKSKAFVEARGRKAAGGSGSLERFSRAALALPHIASAGSTGSPQAGAAAIDRAFAVLADVAQGSTRWSIVYDQSAGVIHWRTDRQQPRRFLRMADVAFSCGSDPLAVDVHAPITGNARPHMASLTAAANHALVSGSTKKTSFTRATPETTIAADARYGFSGTCAHETK